MAHCRPSHRRAQTALAKMRQAEETLAEWAGHEAPLVEKLRGVFKAFQIPDHVASQLCVCVCEREREGETGLLRRWGGR